MCIPLVIGIILTLLRWINASRIIIFNIYEPKASFISSSPTIVTNFISIWSNVFIKGFTVPLCYKTNTYDSMCQLVLQNYSKIILTVKNEQIQCSKQNRLNDASLVPALYEDLYCSKFGIRPVALKSVRRVHTSTALFIALQRLNV